VLDNKQRCHSSQAVSYTLCVPLLPQPAATKSPPASHYMQLRSEPVASWAYHRHVWWQAPKRSRHCCEPRPPGVAGDQRQVQPALLAVCTSHIQSESLCGIFVVGCCYHKVPAVLVLYAVLCCVCCASWAVLCCVCCASWAVLCCVCCASWAVQSQQLSLRLGCCCTSNSCTWCTEWLTSAGS
jgi:hypothetical protein